MRKHKVKRIAHKNSITKMSNCKHERPDCKKTVQLFPKFDKRKDPFYRKTNRLKLMGLKLIK